MTADDLRKEFDHWIESRYAFRDITIVQWVEMVEDGPWSAWRAAYIAGMERARTILIERAKYHEACGVDPVTTSENWDCAESVRFAIEDLKGGDANTQ